MVSIHSSLILQDPHGQTEVHDYSAILARWLSKYGQLDICNTWSPRKTSNIRTNWYIHINNKIIIFLGNCAYVVLVRLGMNVHWRLTVLSLSVCMSVYYHARDNMVNEWAYIKVPSSWNRIFLSFDGIFKSEMLPDILHLVHGKYYSECARYKIDNTYHESKWNMARYFTSQRFLKIP